MTIENPERYCGEYYYGERLTYTVCFSPAGTALVLDNHIEGTNFSYNLDGDNKDTQWAVSVLEDIQTGESNQGWRFKSNIPTIDYSTAVYNWLRS